MIMVLRPETLSVHWPVFSIASNLIIVVDRESIELFSRESFLSIDYTGAPS